MDRYRLTREPFYQPVGEECGLFHAAYARRQPVLLKGPTGCGKTRFVEAMAWRLGLPLVTVACHDDLTAGDLTGRWLLDAHGTRWQDGPLTIAARGGALCYLDEVAEARPDTAVVIHPLADTRRILPLEKCGEVVTAHPDFCLIASYNPGGSAKTLKTSTRQRFVALTFTYPEPATEAAIVAQESSGKLDVAEKLVAFAQRTRRLARHGVEEGASTRMLIHAAQLVGQGASLRAACQMAVIAPLSDDEELLLALAAALDAVA